MIGGWRVMAVMVSGGGGGDDDGGDCGGGGTSSLPGPCAPAGRALSAVKDKVTDAHTSTSALAARGAHTDREAHTDPSARDSAACSAGALRAAAPNRAFAGRQKLRKNTLGIMVPAPEANFVGYDVYDSRDVSA